MIKPSRRFVNMQQARADLLNAIIYSRNLYLNGRRVINARVDARGLLLLEDLYSSADWILLGSSQLSDGNGKAVAFEGTVLEGLR
jgi:hypothetical protein